jgi:hypothetical protein
MVDPYAPQQPGHPWDCPCDDCQGARESYAARQPALIESLDDRDGADEEVGPNTWMDEFGQIPVTLDDDTRALVLDGRIEICPVCGELSAYTWQDTTAYDAFEDGLIPGGFEPEPGTIAHISTSSCWEWECGHCKSHLVKAASPLVHDWS